jgi:hypothetical protein
VRGEGDVGSGNVGKGTVVETRKGKAEESGLKKGYLKGLNS